MSEINKSEESSDLLFEATVVIIDGKYKKIDKSS